MACIFTENKIFTLHVITTGILPPVYNEKDTPLELITRVGLEFLISHIWTKYANSYFI